MHIHKRQPYFIISWISRLLLLLSFMIYMPIASHAESPPFGYKVKKVVIDAGHGGKDPGCRGKHSREKEITLAISLKLGQYIESKFKDVKVIYTRKKDEFIPLHQRATIANKSGADLFISVHCNASKSKAFGTETFVMGLDKSTNNLEVAMRENAVIQLETNYRSFYDGFDPSDPKTKIIFSLYQNSYLNQSINLASEIEKEFKNKAKRNSRGVKQAGFLVLYKTAMPSVLVETGFLTNSIEEKFLRSKDGQAYIASAIFRAFKKYKLGLEKQESGSIEFPEFFKHSLHYNAYWLEGKIATKEEQKKEQLYYTIVADGCLIERLEDL